MSAQRRRRRLPDAHDVALRAAMREGGSAAAVAVAARVIAAAAVFR
ncbi:hypothetical protein [Tahibacter amnicola]|uniref:Uncharacterized protein n=1 Tax=Tahibacter amnicola TaxID=2976241 RepID=A0ABY6BFM3_9GAMM|nr:hypothetical protein [Tahibacter amnicola]UXI68828.1 hypothetical protein N4264_04005 [Tahibacter amnicola]